MSWNERMDVPVLMVAVTTVLGMIPLLKDPFFGAMAVCIMFGLSFACVLTMLVMRRSTPSSTASRSRHQSRDESPNGLQR
jgi:hypothetical protein